MKCYVCGQEGIENNARCPLCGFPVPRMVEDDPGQLAKIKEVAEKYRNKKLEDMKIGMVVYSHEKEGENLKLNQEQQILLAECAGMLPEQIYWYEQKFARVDTDEPIELKIWIQKGKNPARYITVSAKAPDSDGFWHVGVKMLYGFQLQIVLKDDESETKSEPISLSSVMEKQEG